MNIVIYGAGAIGSLIGAFLSRKYDVEFVCRKAYRDAIKKNGLQIIGLSNFVAKPKINNFSDADIVILTVKAYDTLQALRELASVSSKPLLVSLQNGYGIEKLISKYWKGEFLRIVTYQGATYVEPGIIEHAGDGSTLIPNTDNGRYLSRIFNNADIKTKLTNNIDIEIFLKVIVNSCINPLTAICKVKNKYILEKPLKEIMLKVCKECVAVANKYDYNFDYYYVVKRIIRTAKLTGNNKSSMLQDIEFMRLTEIDYLNGAICELGKKVNIDTPINYTLVNIIKRLERYEI